MRVFGGFVGPPALMFICVPEVRLPMFLRGPTHARVHAQKESKKEQKRVTRFESGMREVVMREYV